MFTRYLWVGLHNRWKCRQIQYLWYRVFIRFHEFRAEVQHKLHLDQDYPCDVVGSWNTWYGDQDQAGKWQRHRCITTVSQNPNRLLSNMICWCILMFSVNPDLMLSHTFSVKIGLLYNDVTHQKHLADRGKQFGQYITDLCCLFVAVHLWRYTGGYPALTECLTKLNNNKVGCVNYMFLAF